MISNYFLIAYRNYFKNKSYSLINTLSLSFGFFCFIVILMYVIHEKSYDEHHPQNIYRLALETKAGEVTTQYAQTPPAWLNFIGNDFMEIEASVRIKPPRQAWMISNEERGIHFSEKRWVFADSNVFNFFNIPLVKGNPSHALTGLSKVVITESMEKKYFAESSGVGEVLILDKSNMFEVSAIMQDPPENSHFQFDFIASFEDLKDTSRLYQTNVPEIHFPFTYNYLKLRENASVKALESKLTALVERNTPAQFIPPGTSRRVFLQKLQDIHLYSNLENEIKPNGSAMMVYFFLIIGIFIILIACANFTNMATARSFKRIKEVGVRKTLGANRTELVLQFLGETSAVVLLSFALGLLAVYTLLPEFNALSGKSLAIGFLLDWRMTITMIFTILLTVLLSGSYPSMILSAVRTADVLKAGQHNGTGGKFYLRKVLIAFQFCISTFLVISTIVVYEQMQFTNSINLGLEKDQVVVIQLTDPAPMNAFRAYKSVIEGHTAVKGVSASLNAPASHVFQTRFKGVNTGSEEVHQAQSYWRDFDFLETLGIKLLAGKDFSATNPGDTVNGIIINETAMKKLGYATPDEAINREITLVNFNNPTYRIIAVTEDFHSMSVHEQIQPTLMVYRPSGFFAFVKIDTNQSAEALEWLKNRWNEIVPGYTFDYSFLDQNFDKLYKNEKVLAVLLNFFAFLAVFVACLGLLGLCSFMALQRTKEIGIRKIVGANITDIIILFAREFVLLMLIGYGIGAPLAWIIMSKWLSRFAYKINITPMIFLTALILLVLAMTMTVGYQILKAARANPTKSLRTE
jgi:putative ABC transport system permease protein